VSQTPGVEDKVPAGMDDFLSKSFRIDETQKLTLDGSPASSEIDRQSQIQNRLVYIRPGEWRVKRQLPFTQSLKEILASESHYWTMTPSNKKIPLRTEPSDKIWEEIVLSPLNLAKEWSLADSDENFDDFISRLKKSQSPLKNADGDTIDFAFTGDTGLRIISTGRILQDGKTQVRVESHWEMKERGNANSTSLLASLLRSD